VLATGFLLWQRNGFGLWTLVPGLLRYAYVVSLMLLPAQAEQRRTRFGRVAFLLTASSLLVALALGGDAGRVVAAIGSLVSCASFGRSFAASYPGLGRAVRLALAWVPRCWRALTPTLLFLVAWSWLNLVVNVRYPTPEPGGWYFLPSLDVAVLLTLVAALGLIGWRLPWGLRLPILAALSVARVLRLGDGVTGQYFGKLFNLYTDVPLVPELVRYAHSTVDPWKFYGGVLGVLVIVGLFVFATDRALKYLAAFFQRRHRVLLFIGLALPFAVVSAFVQHDPRYNQRYAGAFGSSVVPRMQREASFLFNVYDHRASEMRAIAGIQERLSHTPARLERLHHANLYLFLIESYGSTVMDRSSFAARALPALKAMELDLGQRGFTMASGRMDSATYGGMSWLAHATLFTGVRTGNQLQYDLLGVSRPRSLARIAHDAGYRTFLVEPNTERLSPVADFYDFDTTYRSWDFDYVGPHFAWATMPDQYVLDFTRRRAIANREGPMFVAYVLVSSHAPWSHVPTLVPDWSNVGNGEIYRYHPFRRAYTNWPDFSNAAEPYVNSILYDMEVLHSYLANFVKDDALVIILGDHQPVSELTENSSSWAVPVHVLSRDPDLVAPFVARGYAHGMVPGQTTSPMESFLVDFLSDYSGGSS
jgi:hypothetical protein